MDARAALILLAAAVTAGCHDAPQATVFPGYAEAELVYIAATSAGTLQALNVRRGDAVARGQPLFALDTDAETLGTDAAAARSTGAQAQADNLLKGRRPLELQALDQQLAQARAALAASTAALVRSQRLVAQGFIAAQRLDELVAARDADAARVKQAEAERAQAAQAARRDEIAAAAAQARGAQADLALARWRASQRQRQAPADAQVYDTLYRPGEWVPAGAPVVALLPPKALKLRFFVPQARLADVAVGKAVQVRCDGCAPQQATVRWVSPQAEFTPPVIYSNESRSKLVFMVEAEPADPAALKPGQPLDVLLPP